MSFRVLLPEPGQVVDELEDWYGDWRAEARTRLRAGFVMSTDGTVAVGGRSEPLSGPADKAAFHALRAVSDAVVVGAGTVRQEDYGPVRVRPSGASWRASHGLPPAPPLVVVSGRCDLSPAARCFGGDTRPFVVTCDAAPTSARQALAGVADVVVCGKEQVDLAGMVAALRDRGLRRLLCEGGPSLLTDLLELGLVDELCLTVAPLLAGAGPGLLTRVLPTPVVVTTRHLLAGEGGNLLWRLSLDGDGASPAAGTDGRRAER
ncbi:MAG: dihydrofolate reductase family protein [Actinomycetota bacterium]|nr:dihydrofolate reductase family protein [Actinomycetota bacterium]